MRPYYVVSPEYESYRGSSDPPEPPEYGCDVVEVEADTRHGAVTAGVKKIMATQNRSYAETSRSDGANPFVGYRAEVAICGHGNPHFVMVGEKAVYMHCWGCEVGL